MAQPLLTRTGVRAIDQALIAAGVPGVVLMENAGRGAAEVIAGRARARGLCSVAVLVGPGNNGGDGYVVARHLRTMAPGLTVTVISPGDPAAMRGEAAMMRDAWRAVGGTVTRSGDDPVQVAAQLAGCDVVVDGLFGTGLDRALTGAALVLVTVVNARVHGLAVALDVPSGLDADKGASLGNDGMVFRADATLTFAVSKPGLHTGVGRRLAGEVTVIGLGAPVPAELMGTTTWLRGHEAVPTRRVDAHKGTAGHVLVVGGSAGRTGAALLSARGAHRGGAGLVTVASRAGETMDVRVLETMCVALPADLTRAREVLTEALDRATVTVIGPGLGSDAWARGMLDLVMARSKGPVVIDADGLALCAARAQRSDVARPATLVLTPHPLEMARLMDMADGAQAVNADRLAVARAAAERFHAVVVLKGAGTVVALPGGDAFIAPYADATLAVAGSGDVLSGVIAARLAESLDRAPAVAVLEAVDAHGRAGHRVRTARGAIRGALASEIADAVSAAMEEPGEA